MAVISASIAKDVAALKPSSWEGATFSSWYLDVTTPLAFLPFARTLVASPTLLDAVAKLAPGDKIELPVGSMDVAARRELLAAIIQAGPKCDSAGERDPITFVGVAAHPDQLEKDGYVLQLQKSGDHIDFRFGNQTVGFWQAWVRTKAN